MLLSEITTFICGTGRIAQVVKCLPGKKKNVCALIEELEISLAIEE
jgi:hypothetical protein